MRPRRSEASTISSTIYANRSNQERATSSGSDRTLQDGDRAPLTIKELGRVGLTRDHLAVFAWTQTHDDHVIVEATGNASAVVEVIRPYVGRLVITNPRQVRLIAEARTKTDAIDASVLARLYASGFLPE